MENNKEQNWIPIWSSQAKIQPTPVLHDHVLFGLLTCPYCEGKTQYTVLERLEGSDDRRAYLRPCRCAGRRFTARRKYIERILPPRYTLSNVATLQPSTESKMSVARQAKVIQYLQANPDESYFLFGPPGTGKTTFATSLVRRALDRDWRQHCCFGPQHGRMEGEPYDIPRTMWIHYVNWDALIQSYLDFQNHPKDNPPPTLTPKIIREQAAKGKRVCVAIEEVDKSRLTEYKANKLFELVCAIDETKGQLILTTNHRSEESFQSWLYKKNSEEINIAGEATWRRIVANCKMIECKEG